MLGFITWAKIAQWCRERWELLTGFLVGVFAILFFFLRKGSDKEVLEYEYEPEREALLNEIVPKNIAIQLYHAFLETFASEQGARMTAMDNAVNNCTDLVKRLNLEYNRTRQAKITTELVEIISAAESI